MPISANPLNSGAFLALARAGGLIFINGLMLALPIVTLLLTINLALGFLNRVAPQLSIFVVGFPITLAIGIMTIGLLIPLLRPSPSAYSAKSSIYWRIFSLSYPHKGGVLTKRESDSGRKNQ